MMTRFRPKSLLLVVAGLSFFSCGLTTALAGQPINPDPVNPAYDLLQTPPGGGILDFGPLLGPGAPVIPLVGQPIGPGNTDTIVRRDPPGLGPLDTGIISAEIVALSLVSINPVPLDLGTGSTLWDVHVGLPALLGPPLAPSLGQINITSHGPNGGTFDSFFDVFVEVSLTEVGNPGNQVVVQHQDQISSAGSLWSHTPPPGYPQHPHYPGGGFYPGVDPVTGAIVGVQHSGPHPNTRPATPEPASVLLLILGCVGMSWLVRRR